MYIPGHLKLHLCRLILLHLSRPKRCTYTECCDIQPVCMSGHRKPLFVVVEQFTQFTLQANVHLTNVSWCAHS